MNTSASLYIKILSLAVVVGAVLSTSWLTVLDAGWVPWLALLLLMLLEAYATDSKPASWSQWSAGLLKLQGPGMLPYYAVLVVTLAFGPGQMRNIPQPGPPAFPAPLASLNKFDRSNGIPTQHPVPTSTPTRPVGFPVNNVPPTPKTFKPTAPKLPATNTGSSPSRPSTFPVNPTNNGPARSPAQSLPSATPPAKGSTTLAPSPRPSTTPNK